LVYACFPNALISLLHYSSFSLYFATSIKLVSLATMQLDWASVTFFQHFLPIRVYYNISISDDGVLHTINMIITLDMVCHLGFSQPQYFGNWICFCQ